ncbi:MAG: hypothetical protein JNM78_08190 [Cyclobacteriaceae bacterium]|nr:hypothetical protein [Cyclobacteriaceae bacterium]
MMIIIGFFIMFGIVFGTMKLWNWLVPELFNGPILNLWQALGLLVLSKIFLWSFGGKCHCNHGNHGRGPWKYYWKEKWGSMTSEDREKFKQKMKDKWCYKEESAPTDNSATSND